VVIWDVAEALIAHLVWNERGRQLRRSYCDAFEGMKGYQPKSDKGLKEWLATDEGKQATMFEPTLVSRWGEIEHA
jgi:hypothetical protein